ncbi:MAG: NAD-dependent epimerase/dehydratase family protein, partial [Ruminiclostridium sp.]|nr:NAD-dependent epimerase/dehydratase family protein [Ruminiclostridium sp.]
DITAYNKKDVSDLVDSLGNFGSYIFISSSAVYPETLPQPFKETDKTGFNSVWGDYGKNKIEAEEYLQSRIPNAYIIRPPYLYGAMNNLYREAFVFDCASENRSFFLPNYYNSEKGKIPLQFFDVEDLCRFMEVLLEKQPKEHIFNVGNTEITDVKGWVDLCYNVLGKKPRFEYVSGDINQRNYFPFYNYGYILDTRSQNALMPGLKPLNTGIEQSFEWYINNKDKVYRKNYIEFIDKNFK